MRHDLFGFGDILAIHPGRRETILIQTTTSAHLLERVRKCCGLATCAAWIETGNAVHLHGWGLRKARTRRRTWIPRLLTLHLTRDTSGTPVGWETRPWDVSSLYPPVVAAEN